MDRFLVSHTSSPQKQKLVFRYIHNSPFPLFSSVLKPSFHNPFFLGALTSRSSLCNQKASLEDVLCRIGRTAFLEAPAPNFGPINRILHWGFWIWHAFSLDCLLFYSDQFIEFLWTGKLDMLHQSNRKLRFLELICFSSLVDFDSASP